MARDATLTLPEFKPGQRAKVQLKLTDYAGKPFVGSTVIAIYDKSVEYISGGSNVPEIKEFFWKWRRSHNPVTESNLGGFPATSFRPMRQAMNDLGVFGGSVAEDPDAPADEAQWGDTPDRSASAASGMGGMTLNRGETVEKAARGADGHGTPRPRFMPLAPARHADGSATFLRDDARRAGRRLRRGPLVQPTIRSKFADTALWVGQLTTASNGTAEVELNMPENLTTWRIKAWGMGFGSRVGQGQTDVVTRKDLIIRMECPRFFVAERRGRALGRRAQLSEDEKERPGIAGTRRANCMGVPIDVMMTDGNPGRSSWRGK